MKSTPLAGAAEGAAEGTTEGEAAGDGLAEGAGEGFVPPEEGSPLEGGGDTDGDGADVAAGAGLAEGATEGAGEVGVASTVEVVVVDSDFELSVGILISLLQLIKAAVHTNGIKCNEVKRANVPMELPLRAKQVAR